MWPACLVEPCSDEVKVAEDAGVNDGTDMERVRFDNEVCSFRSVGAAAHRATSDEAAGLGMMADDIERD